ncbi:MAG: prolyl oligopeptidase family serine peptidase [Polyangiaceae bacterium]
MARRALSLGSLALTLGVLACTPPPAVPAPTSPDAGPAAPAPPSKPYPPTEQHEVSDSYHGVTVVDPYRWLEDWNDPKVKAWSDAQNQYARTVLDALPARDRVSARLRTLLGNPSPRFYAPQQQAGRIFAMKEQPPKQQPFLIVLDELGDPAKAKVVLDPNVLDPSGATTIDFYAPSHDGKLVAVSLSKAGSESGDVHVYEVATGQEKFEVIPRVNGGTAGGSLAWDAEDEGFFYSRYPRGDERPKADMDFYVQVYHHRLGEPTEKDRYEIGKDFPRIAEIELKTNEKTGQVLATVQEGDGGRFAIYLRGKDGAWKQFSTYGDGVIQAELDPRGEQLYLLSRDGAPRGKVLRMPTRDLDIAKAKVVIAEGEDTIVGNFWGAPSLLPTQSRLYVLYQLGGPSEIRVFDTQGKALPKPHQLPVAAADGMTPIGADDILFLNWSYVQPEALFHHVAKGDETEATKLASTAPADLSKVTVVREMATSKDGTKVPVNILLPPGYQKGTSMPCIVNAYGGYGVSIAPRFRPYYSLLLEQGVCYAVANIRGGGEFGEAWHKGGNLLNKQNVFDDFDAVLGHLVEAGYTTRDKLAIIGGSNGGLLMGAELTQHPDCCKAVVSFVGIYDMLRVELSPNGAFNVTEFGTVKDEAQFKALHAYSPYHHVVDGTAYPPILMLTGANDPRVDPMQSRKMVARLQAATPTGVPILLRTDAAAGHGIGSSLEQEIAELTDVYAFLFAELGVSVSEVR